MRRSAIFCAVLLTACGDPSARLVPAPPVPADLLAEVRVICPPVMSEADVAACLIRQRAGLDRANGQITALREILGPQ